MFLFSNNAIKRQQELKKSSPGTVSLDSHSWGMSRDEPLIVMMDCLRTYAVAYEKKFQAYLADDAVLGNAWLNAANGIRALLNGDGAAAMLIDRSTDSKDNGTVETMFWDAMRAAGFIEKEL